MTTEIPPIYKYTPKPGVPKAIRTAASLMGKRNKGVLKHISEDERLARGERARHCTEVRMARMKGELKQEGGIVPKFLLYKIEG